MESGMAAVASSRVIIECVTDSEGGGQMRMRRISTAFLQGVVVLLGLGVFGFMVWEPQIEGRNAHATTFEIYFADPFLAYAYVASIPFFVALYRAFALIGYAGRNEAFSPAAVKASKTIKRCALSLIGFVLGGLIFIMLQDSDDRAGGVFMVVLIMFGSFVIAAASAMFERILQSAAELKSENDLTI